MYYSPYDNKLRNFTYEFLVDKKPLLAPDSNVDISETDLDSSSSGRDESGIMHRIVIREGVRTWGFTYAFLAHPEYSYILSLFKGKPTFEFEFRDVDGRPASVTAYCSKRSIVLHDAATGLFKNLKFNIIEC